MQPPSRRTVLALGLITLTAACTNGTDGDVTPGDKGPAPDSDHPVRLRAVAATDTLLTAYDTLLTTPGAQTALLQTLRAETARHRAALAYGVPAASVPPPPGTPTAATPGTTPATLAALERQTAQARLADLGAARPPLARLLASVAAANALHATTLGAPTEQPDQPTTTPTPTATPGAAVPALQKALSAEHAAVYGYGVVGAHLPDDQQRTDARTAYAAHQSQRDAWQRLITTLGSTPTPAAAGYRLPFTVTDPTTAAKLAAHLETSLTTVYADLVADLPTPHRPTAATALRDCTLRAHRWGAPDTPFPGIPEPLPTPTPTTTTRPT